MNKLNLRNQIDGTLKVKCMKEKGPTVPGHLYSHFIAELGKRFATNASLTNQRKESTLIEPQYSWIAIMYLN